MVTGQYFMSQVNSKLTSLATSVGKLEKMLDAQRHGELKAITQELEDIREKAEYIIIDTKLIQTKQMKQSIRFMVSNALQVNP